MTETKNKKRQAIPTASLVRLINKRFGPQTNKVTKHVTPDRRDRIVGSIQCGWLTTGCMLLRVGEKFQQQLLSKILIAGGEPMNVKNIPKPKKEMEDWDLKFYEIEQTHWIDDTEVQLHAVYASVHESPIFMVQSRLLLLIQKHVPKDAVVKTDGNWLQWYVDGDDFPVAILAGIKKV
jgi:hypothetical protein